MKKLMQYDVYEVPVADIFYDDAFNCRGAFTAQSVHDLAESIRENGLQFPIVVQPYDKPGFMYRILAGHRRFKATTLFLKWVTIPAIVRDDLDEHQCRILNLLENLERKDLNMMEEAQALHNLYPNDDPLRQVSKELKRPTRWVQVRRKLMELPEEIQKWTAAGFIAATNIEAIVKLDTKEQQVKAARAIVNCKKKGKTRFLDVDPKYKRAFRARRSKPQITALIAHLITVNCDGLTSRILAWVAGRITNEEIEQDIQNEPTYEAPDEGYVLPYGKD